MVPFGFAPSYVPVTCDAEVPMGRAMLTGCSR